MPRNLKLTLAYDGHDFAGWQVQPDRLSIQGTLVSAFEHLIGEKTLPQASGRTDAGVHALAQIATVSIASPIPATNLVRALNDVLPRSIRVLNIQEAPSGFHARHSAIAKTYRYHIFRGAICSPFQARYVYHHPYPLDESQMIASAALVQGQHDFTSFAAVDPDRQKRLKKDIRHQGPDLNQSVDINHGLEVTDRPENNDGPEISETLEQDRPDISEALAVNQASEINNVRTIFLSTWHRQSDELIYTVRGNGFLHHMVRNLVGMFLLVGKGTLKKEDVRRILDLRDRSAAAATAPASGLFLVNVEYESVQSHVETK